jgi:hypothetical protein
MRSSLARDGLYEFYSHLVFQSLSTIGWCLVNINFVAPKIGNLLCRLFICMYILSRDLVTIDGVWIGNRIY